jgi:glycerol-3-phosphate acyltransferase PlsY
MILEKTAINNMALSLTEIIFLISTYAVSSLPFGLIIAKLIAKKDIREFGSGNIGATNVTRLMGKKWGLITLILDGMKGAIMVMIGRYSFSNSANLNLFLVLVAAIAVIGHVFPLYLRFKGGKGVATTFAVLLAINPLLGIVNCMAWLIIFALSKVSALASLSSIIVTIIFALIDKVRVEEIILCAFLAILILIRHRQNITRMLQGQENKF